MRLFYCFSRPRFYCCIPGLDLLGYYLRCDMGPAFDQSVAHGVLYRAIW